jgi:hypothetical protein
MSNVSDESCRENQNRVVYEIMSKNVVETEEPLMTLQYGACALHAE